MCELIRGCGEMKADGKHQHHLPANSTHIYHYDDNLLFVFQLFFLLLHSSAAHREPPCNHQGVSDIDRSRTHDNETDSAGS